MKYHREGITSPDQIAHSRKIGWKTVQRRCPDFTKWHRDTFIAQGYNLKKDPDIAPIQGHWMGRRCYAVPLSGLPNAPCALWVDSRLFTAPAPTPPPKHARNSPSTLDNLTQCVRFKYGDTDTGAADEGTQLHAAFESGDLRGLNEEQRTVVEQARIYVEGLMQGHPEKWIDLTERRVELRDLTWGHADRILIHRVLPLIHVIDFKSTRRESEHEFQARTYGAAVLEELTTETPSRFHEGTCVELHTHVIAPRIKSIQHHQYDGYQLLNDVRQDIEALYERIANPFTPPTPTPDLCEKCARASECPALGVQILDSTSRLRLPVPSTFDPAVLQSPRDRACAQALAGIFANWAKQIKSMNAEWAQNGTNAEALAPYGYRVQSRSTGLRVPAEFQGSALEALRETVPADVLDRALTVSLPELCAAWSEARQVPDSEVREEVKALLGDLIVEGRTSFLAKTKRIPDDVLLHNIVESARQLSAPDPSD